MNSEKIKTAESLFQKCGPVLKTRLLRESGLHSRLIAQLISEGYIRKIRTGYYVWNTAETETSDIALCAASVPFGVVCLQSAAVLHELSTINPIAVSIAVPNNYLKVTLPEYPPIELFSYPRKTFDLGIDHLQLNSINIRIYDKERTVCDFFRKRKQLGDDLAIEVLKTYIQGKVNLQQLFEYADALRVKSVMKPYVEALV